MTVESLVALDGMTPLVLCEPKREIDGVYIGDLLSWVMGNASSGDVWITIMSNINILAVASLSDVSCIILAEGVALEQDVIITAREKGINIISSELSTFETAVLLSHFL